jgi:hypothetical protein
LTVYEGETALGPYVTLGTVQITPPQRPLDVASLRPLFTATETGGVTFFRAGADRLTAAPGDELLFTVEWENMVNVAAAVTLSLHDGTGASVQAWEIPLPAYGPGFWRSQQPVTLAAALEDGEYTWQLAFPNAQLAHLDNLTIDAPERLFTPLPMETAVNSTLMRDGQPAATLVGFTFAESACQQPPTVCPITLLWRVENETRNSYRVFVQLLDDQGRLVAQVDGVPGNWERPSTGWLAEEYIIDAHQLILDEKLLPGSYVLIAGLYGEDGVRLRTNTGADNLHLTAVDFADHSFEN